MQLVATGHLIDSGILSKALDMIGLAEGRYRMLEFEVGKTKGAESRVVLEVSAPSPEQLDQILDNLGVLGFCAPDETDAETAPAPMDGVAPQGFYSTTNLRTRVRINGAWIPVTAQRMDAMLVVEDSSARCVKLRDLRQGDAVVVGHQGVQVTPDTKARESSDFAFMSSEVSSERRVEAQAKYLAGLWRETKDAGAKVALVGGPVIVHSGQADTLASMIRRGWVDALLAGNALAVHDVEAAVLGTSLGVSQETGQPVLHGHMNHMRAINLVRASGGLAGAVAKGQLTHGIMHALVTTETPYCLAGSIRDDGPLPETEMDLVRAQDRYAELLADVELVVVFGTMLHGIGTGNMLPASTTLVCVDINPAVASKLADRGSSHTVPIVTDAGLFLAELEELLGERDN